MALKTLGTLLTTSLNGFQLPPGYNATPTISAADWATLMQSIFDDSRNPQQLLNQQILSDAVVRAGWLFVPNRGNLRVHGGDWIAVDAAGWPVVIGRNSLPQTLTATGNLDGTTGSVTNLSVNVLNQGWWAGMPISGTGVAAGSIINSIAANGLSLVMSKNSTAPEAATTLTAGAWTHS
jgi:hypothetical protein